MPSSLIRLCKDAGFSEKQWSAMTYESGPYDITEPTVELLKLAKAIRQQERDRCANDVFALAKVMDSRPSGATVAHWLETAGYRILKLEDEGR